MKVLSLVKDLELFSKRRCSEKFSLKCVRVTTARVRVYIQLEEFSFWFLLILWIFQCYLSELNEKKKLFFGFGLSACWQRTFHTEFTRQSRIKTFHLWLYEEEKRNIDWEILFFKSDCILSSISKWQPTRWNILLQCYKLTLLSKFNVSPISSYT